MNGTLRTRIAVAWVVVFIWSTAALAALVTQNLEELGIVTPVMMIVVGFLFGYKTESHLTPQDGARSDDALH